MPKRSAIFALVLGLTLIGSALSAPAGLARDGGAWHLVRYSQQITQSDVEALEALGGRSLQYYPHDSYLAWMTSAQAGLAAGSSRVVSAEELSAEFKIDRSLDLEGEARPILATVYRPRALSTVAALASRFQVAAVHPVPRGTLVDVILVAEPSVARELAARPEVLYVGAGPAGPVPLDEISDQIQAGNNSGSSVPPGYEQWLQSVGLSGQGVRVSVVDTGVDPHPDFQDRIVANVRYTPAGSAPAGEMHDGVGHGTHVAGIIGGNPTSFPQIGQIKDGGGYLYGLGVAPEVELINQNALSATASGLLCGSAWPPRYPWSDLTEDALDNGASIWNASWWDCTNARADYIESSRVFDFLARDGDTRAAGAQPFTFVFAAGNNGAGSSNIGSPSSAKNLITVGATNNTRGGHPDQTATFSSRGPMADGRVGPTVSAPGGAIISTKSFAGALCNVPPQDSLGLYADCSGTSMAAPHVAGAVALATEWWRKTHETDPSPAMMRALLVNTATDMGAPNIPNKDEGWGRVNIGSLFDASATRVYADQTTVLDDPGDSTTLRITPADASKPVKLTVAWSDAPGAAGADPALVNDLDLTVATPNGDLYWGNNFVAGKSVPGPLPEVLTDQLNNIENVFLAPGSGTYTVTISAANIPGDGVPYSGDETDQDFALVLSNAVVQAA